MHIVFLQCWHTRVHRPASPCIFFLRRGWEGGKPPDKNKFCSRSSAARVSPTRSPLFPIISFTSSHPLSAQQLLGLFGLSLLFFPSPLLRVFCICGKCANCFHVCVSAFFRDVPLQACVIAYFAGLRLTAANSSCCVSQSSQNHHHFSHMSPPSFKGSGSSAKQTRFLPLNKDVIKLH